MPLPKCGVLWPTNRAEKGIDAAKLTFKLTHYRKVTGVDFVPKALDKARIKAGAANLSINFVHADVTHLSQEGIGADFPLIVDNGCLHNMSDGDRDAYVREVSAVAAPDARLLIVAFLPGGRFGVRGVDPAEMEQRFAPAWTLLSAGHERELDREKTPARYYLFQRRPCTPVAGG